MSDYDEYTPYSEDDPLTAQGRAEYELSKMLRRAYVDIVGSPYPGSATADIEGHGDKRHYRINTLAETLIKAIRLKVEYTLDPGRPRPDPSDDDLDLIEEIDGYDESIADDWVDEFEDEGD